ncbi:MAG: hypothetical protein V5788_08965 [Shewanella sp.]
MKIKLNKTKSTSMKVSYPSVILAVAFACTTSPVLAQETAVVEKSEQPVKNGTEGPFKSKLTKEEIAEIKEAPGIAGVYSEINDSNPYLAADETDHTLILTLKNEYRGASRPSATGDYGPDVDAWVQYGAINYQSDNLLNWIDIEAGVYTTQKLHADPNKSARFYLNGHDDFTLVSGSVNIKPTENIQLKLGRFGTDSGAGTLEYYIPLIEKTSIRPTPSMKEGALLQVDFDNLHLYGMVSTKFAGHYYSEWTDEGTIQGVNPDGSLIRDKIPKYHLAGVWNNTKGTGTRLAFGTSYQENHSYQYMFNAQQLYIDSNKAFWKAELRGFYAELIDYTKDLNTMYMGSGYDNTYLVSGQLTYHNDGLTLIGSAGQVGTKLSFLTMIDTDLGYSFDQSIDRNHNDMLSWQIGGFYQVTKTLQTGIAIVKTDGYEDPSEEVHVDGTGVNLIFIHQPGGVFEGLKSTLILNKAREYRPGSTFGDELDYWDVKLTFHYDINIF